jgi:phage terminase large subunit-like protein
LRVRATRRFLRDEQQDAIADSRLQNRFKTKHLNIWCQAREAWMNMVRWEQQTDSTLREEDFEGEPCCAGLDLASKHDVTSYVKVFRKIIDNEEHFYPFWRHYVPEERVHERPDSYTPWVKDGHLVATEGEELDFGRVRRDIVADRDRFYIQRLGHDQHLAVQLAQELSAEGIMVVAIPQNVKYFSDPMKWIYAKTLAGRIHHDGNPATNWMFSNVTARIDANDNIFPRKEHVDNKIDGVVALLMAMYLAMSTPAPMPLRAYAI